MVVPLGPGKFYGSSLPRPRIYTDVKFNSDRVDPPTPVSDPLMSWASEAHWSMGGLSFKRFRLQGRIEGNVNKLRYQREKSLKKRNKISGLTADKILDSDDEEEEVKDLSPSPPPAPFATKRKRFKAETDQEDEEDILKRSGGGEMGGGRKRLARKLGKEFDRVAAVVSGRESPAREAETVAGRTRSRMVEESGGGDVSKVNLKAKKRLRRVGEIEEEKSRRAAAAAERESGVLKSGSVVRTSPRLFLR